MFKNPLLMYFKLAVVLKTESMKFYSNFDKLGLYAFG